MTLARRLLGGGVASAALALGAAFYVFCRAQEAWFVGRALRSDLVGPMLVPLRARTLPASRALPALVMDAAPDFLWGVAAGALLRALAPGGIATRLWLALGAFTVVGYELAQAWHLVSGTFDRADLVAQILGYALGATCFRAERRGMMRA